MMIMTTFGEALRLCYDWAELCDDLGVDEWCLNEGRVESDDDLEMDIKIAKKHGLC